MARPRTRLCRSVEELESIYFPKMTTEQKRAEKLSAHALAATANQEKSSIKLRCRKRKNSLTLYLDQYANGTRSYEYLPKEFCLNIEVDEQTRQNNLATLEASKKILNERRDTLLLKGVGIETNTRSNKKKLLPYIDKLADEQLEKSGNKHSYYFVLKSLALHITGYCGSDITIAQADSTWCKDFFSYLKTKAVNLNHRKSVKKKKDLDHKTFGLSLNYQNQLYNKLNYVFNKAVEDDILQANPLAKVPVTIKPKTETDTREFLTIDEIKLLYKTECKQPQLKQAFLFCCLVGLRFSDVKQMEWRNFHKTTDGETMLTLEMQKLKHLSKNVRTLNVPVSEEAQKWLPIKGKANAGDKVFSLPDNEQTNIWLRKWVASAGITKKITFHCSRHTSATLNLNLGVPVERVMKLMGHSKIATTQIYAKVLAESLKGETSKQNGIFD